MSQQAEWHWLSRCGLLGGFRMRLKKVLIWGGENIQEHLRVLLHEFKDVIPFPFGLSNRPDKSVPRLLIQGFFAYIPLFDHLNDLKRLLSAYHPPFQLTTLAEYRLHLIFRLFLFMFCHRII